MPKRILLADDHTLMLEGLKSLLSPEFEVVGTVHRGRDVLPEAERLRPDAVVLDIGMPDMNGIEIARRLSFTLPEVKIIFVTQQLGRAYLQAAFTAGAKAFVPKQSAGKELVHAIHKALRGEYYITPMAAPVNRISSGADSKRSTAGVLGVKLTPRQGQILQLVTEGKTSKEISALLSISVKTVEFHRASLMQELGTKSTAELVRYALSQGLI